MVKYGNPLVEAARCLEAEGEFVTPFEMGTALALAAFDGEECDFAVIEVGMGGRLDPTNIITPMMTYYAVIIIFAQRYDKKAGIGTITATMLPYSICFLVFWTLLLILWLSAGLPIGVGTSIFYPAV